jgi:hypothetical protein
MRLSPRKSSRSALPDAVVSLLLGIHDLAGDGCDLRLFSFSSRGRKVGSFLVCSVAAPIAGE